MEWFYSWSIDIKKRACCYLIQRYFGKYFKQKLNLGQLSVDLYNGTATVMDLRLDCEVRIKNLFFLSNFWNFVLIFYAFLCFNVFLVHLFSLSFLLYFVLCVGFQVQLLKLFLSYTKDFGYPMGYTLKNAF